MWINRGSHKLWLIHWHSSSSKLNKLTLAVKAFFLLLDHSHTHTTNTCCHSKFEVKGHLLIAHMEPPVSQAPQTEGRHRQQALITSLFWQKSHSFTHTHTDTSFVFGWVNPNPMQKAPPLLQVKQLIGSCKELSSYCTESQKRWCASYPTYESARAFEETHVKLATGFSFDDTLANGPM